MWTARPDTYKEGQDLVLDSLPEDILVLVVDACAQIPTPAFPHALFIPLSIASPAAPGRPLKELSLANRHFRELCIPKLFRHSRLRDTHYEKDDKLYHRLAGMLETPHVLQTVRWFVVSGYRCLPYHHDLPITLIRVLNAMPNLQELGLRFWHKAEILVLPMLESLMTFSETKLLIPTLKGFWLDHGTQNNNSGSYAVEFFAKAFPNLEKAHLRLKHTPRGSKLIEELGKLKTFKCLLLEKDVPMPRHSLEEGLGWTVSDVEMLHRMCPKITHLALKGQLEDTEVSAFVHVLSHFRKLEQLDITDEQAIEYHELVGDYDWDDEDGFDEMMEETVDLVMDHHLNDDREDVAMSLFSVLPTLKRVCFAREILGYSELYEPATDDQGAIVGADLVDDFSETPPDEHVIEWEDDNWPKVMALRISL